MKLRSFLFWEKSKLHYYVYPEDKGSGNSLKAEGRNKLGTPKSSREEYPFSRKVLSLFIDLTNIHHILLHVVHKQQQQQNSCKKEDKIYTNVTIKSGRRLWASYKKWGQSALEIQNRISSINILIMLTVLKLEGT